MERINADKNQTGVNFVINISVKIRKIRVIRILNIDCRML